MDAHPLSGEPKRWIAAGALALSLAGVHALLLMVYTHTPPVIAIADGVLSAGLLCILIHWAWYATGFMPLRVSRFLLGIMAVTVWLTGCFAFQSLIEWVSHHTYIPFRYTFPFRLLFGTLVWIAVMLWYRVQLLNSELRAQEEEPPANEKAVIIEEPAAAESIPEQELIDRITVKDGSRIHLIEAGKLLYIQACGDYVTLITADGQYVKEQTMKYFETHLSPALFVRIHRSYIVNVSQISRVELFGKENYQMLLKNGTKLKMSNTGYKLLKDKLNL